MKFNYILDDTNHFISCQTEPFDSTAPWLEADTFPLLMVDMLIDGNIVRDEERYTEFQNTEAKQQRILELHSLLHDVQNKIFENYLSNTVSEEELATLKEQCLAYLTELKELAGD